MRWAYFATVLVSHCARKSNVRDGWIVLSVSASFLKFFSLSFASLNCLIGATLSLVSNFIRSLFWTTTRWPCSFSTASQSFSTVLAPGFHGHPYCAKLTSTDALFLSCSLYSPPPIHECTSPWPPGVAWTSVLLRKVLNPFTSALTFTDEDVSVAMMKLI